MKYSKRLIYKISPLIGLITILVGLFPIYIETYFLPKRYVLINSNWIIIIGFIFLLIGLLLIMTQKKDSNYNIEISLVATLLISVVFTAGWLYGQYEHTIVMSTQNIEKMREQLLMKDYMENNNPFYTKKIIIRDDDIGNYSYIQSVRWLADLCTRKDVKVTYAVIPNELTSNPETIAYLNTLNRTYFEFATHGYEHIAFKEMSYNEQYDLIRNATSIIEEKLNYRPLTFVPPCGSGDTNTTKACKSLGYHSITDVLGYPSYVIDFTSDFEWEENYNPISHHKLTDFESSFDNFYNSTDEYYIIYLHDWTFLDNRSIPDKEKTKEFEKAVDYMKRDNVQFFTIEEAYRWKVDEPSIRTFEIDKHNYSIDLTECQYNHTIKFCSPLKEDDFIVVRDMNTHDEISFNENTFEFSAMKGHWYIISTLNKFHS